MTNETKQTAVEWLIEQFYNNEGMLTTKKLEKAKEMEKDRLINAQMDMFHFLNNLEFGMQYLDKRDQAEDYCKQYYNETYGGNK